MTDENMVKIMRPITFNPTISFDGVAIIVVCVSCTLWFGALSTTIREHTENIKHLTQIQETQAQSLRVMSENIAVLTTLVNERTKK